jgi:hypothetical protein
MGISNIFKDFKNFNHFKIYNQCGKDLIWKNKIKCKLHGQIRITYSCIQKFCFSNYAMSVFNKQLVKPIKKINCPYICENCHLWELTN